VRLEQYYGNRKKTEVCISVNGTIFRSLVYDPSNEVSAIDSIYQMREIFVDNLKQGKNIIELQSSNLEANMMFEVKKYYLEDVVKKELQQLAAINASWDQRQYKTGQVAHLVVNVDPKDGNELDALMVEIPIPAGFSLAAISDVTPSDSNWHKEWNENSKKIACFVSKLQSSVSIQVKLTASLPGKILSNPCRAFEMYHPDGVAVSGVCPLEIY